MRIELPSDVLEGTGFTGKVLVDMPKHQERLRLAKALALEEKNTGTEADGLDSAIKLCEITEKHLLEVDLLHVESGKKVDSLEMFFMLRECSALGYRIGSAIVEGLALGKL